ncbi:MAG: sugar ABC transporter permease [Clostridia bacterium]|nr:sugar ABC transporter permease [Clostridia bacterium]
MSTVKKKVFDKKLAFYCAMVALPILQFLIFYVYVNFNSFILAFTNYEGGMQTFAGFENFKKAFIEFFNSPVSAQHGVQFKNSLVFYGLSMAFHTGFAVLFSYYIYKKQLFSGLFKIILFLPNIIPGIAMATIYKQTVSNALKMILADMGIIVNSFFDSDLTFGVILFYNLFFGYGTQVMMYLGAMNKINPAITEASELDGASFMRELWSITLPCIFSTISTFVVVGLTGIFAADMGLYSFFGEGAPSSPQTLGYWLMRETRMNIGNESRYPFIATVGLCFTIIVAPITIVLRRLLDKLDPLN